MGSPSPNHNICYSQSSFDATSLASQRQFRSVLDALNGVEHHHSTVDRSQSTHKSTVIVVEILCVLASDPTAPTGHRMMGVGLLANG